MARPVIFLVFASALVFPDEVAVVLIQRTAGNQAGLFVLTRSKAIEIQAGFVLDRQWSFRDQPVEIVSSKGIDLIGVDVRSIRHIDLRSRDVQKTEWISRGEFACLLS